MGRRSLLLLLAALLLPIGTIATVHRLNRPRPEPAAPATDRGRRAATAPVAAPAPVPATDSAPVPGIDPNLPLYVGATKRIAAQAIDDTAANGFEPALAQLPRLFAGSPAQAEGTDVGTRRLRLDLTQFDDLRFVEQLLALVNSRQVRTKTEAVDRFSDHVRRLRYEGGLVAPCRLHSRRTDWAAAAARRGYLVNLTPYLPGARQRSIPASAPSTPAPPVRTGAAARPAAAAGAPTVAPCPPPPGLGRQTFLPLAALPAALAGMRSGDLVLLLDRDARSDARRIGVIERLAGDTAIWLAQPGQGVVQVPDLGQLARRDPAVIGLMIFRPIPNADARAGG